jgi:hypothetical protein
MNEELVQAIDASTVAHALWKARLMDALEGGELKLDRKAAGDPHACEFGKWIDGNLGLAATHPEFELCRAKHAAFHARLAECLGWIAAGRTREARLELESDGEFRKLSGGIVMELLRWRDRLLA